MTPLAWAFVILAAIGALLVWLACCMFRQFVTKPDERAIELQHWTNEER